LPARPVKLGSWAPGRSSDVPELLLELLSEEIPARMQHRGITDLTGLLRDKLVAAEIPATSLRSYVTPRRLAIIADGIPGVQPDRTEERRGPRVGAPQPAIDGFLRSAGLAFTGQCEIRDTGRGEFYFAALHHPGRPAAQVLPEVIRAAMAELPWPKSMRYPASSLRWVRPLVSILCLFDGEVLPLALDRIPVGRVTRGHRFLSPGEICVGSAGDYVERLGEAHVVLDHERRREMIWEALSDTGWCIVGDSDLLDEVTGLVEFPVVLVGTIDPEFMQLPREVLTTAMRRHQKYFSCVYPDGTPAPRFILIANNIGSDGGKTIIAGNERVLRARLADARFFWDADLRVPLEHRLTTLKDRVFHAKLGSVYDKVVRMEALAEYLAPHVPGADPGISRRAVRLAKADLSTRMVGEFPELQGTIGQHYYIKQHQFENADTDKQLENLAIAVAIGDHYKPLGPRDSCPAAPVSIVAALVDKIDSLVALFAIGEKPTGSRDPFALRRAALGVIRLVLENHLRLSLRGAFSIVEDGLGLFAEVQSELLAFVVERLKVHLREYGFRHDLIAAVFAPSEGRKAEDDLLRLHDRVIALGTFLTSPDGDGANLLTAFRRASSIVAIEERQDGFAYDGETDEELFREPEERALASRLAEVNHDLRIWLEQEDFVGAMSILASLRRPIDEFFEKVTVNTDEPKLRENRLRLLSRIRATINQVADFSQIEG
jgi:glycyl-tRNA synthetase beta chain